MEKLNVYRWKTLVTRQKQFQKLVTKCFYALYINDDEEYRYLADQLEWRDLSYEVRDRLWDQDDVSYLRDTPSSPDSQSTLGSQISEETLQKRLEEIATTARAGGVFES